ncbi:hypothetical protein ROA7745_00777 [Roseovarius aestuarii]|uniref:VPLPA-CTERM protein sorting domain protein n=3 Tax=Roseovarius aestuarii TaxID=475083 RepID=A0A1X7BMW4_9RHOB|nr:hypothetical protein ROA7745_00777 [Roseovarius aestuarii]
MLKHMMAAAVLAAGMSVSSAQAAVLDLTDLIRSTSGGFTSSLIHDQRNGKMSGNKRGQFGSAITGGTFNTTTGAIQFDGTIRKQRKAGGFRTSTFKAVGNLSTSATRTNGLFGNIQFTFTGNLLSGKVLNFLFKDKNYTNGGQPNGFASNGTQNFIALWGDLGNYNRTRCTSQLDKCFGIDLRIAYKPGGGGGGVPSPVPLPASALFLLAGIGGLGAVRKLRKKA